MIIFKKDCSGSLSFFCADGSINKMILCPLFLYDIIHDINSSIYKIITLLI